MNDFRAPAQPLKTVCLRLPRRRLMAWHLALVRKLSADFTVTLEFADGPALPMAVKVWLAMERLVLGDLQLCAPVRPAAFSKVEQAGETTSETIVVDLTGKPGKSDGALRPVFDGVTNEAALFGALMSRRRPVIGIAREGAGDRLLSSYAAIETPGWVCKAATSSYARLTDLIVRACHGRRHAMPLDAPARPAKYASTRLAAGAAIMFGAQKIGAALINPFISHHHWQLAFRSGGSGGGGPSADGWQVLDLPRNALHADPFFQTIDGQLYVFAERYCYTIAKGHIVCARVNEAGKLEPFVTALERPYHLSYPMTFTYGGDLYMIPETGTVGRLELYRCVSAPAEWKLDRVLMDGVNIWDATVFEHDGRWWMFATVSSELGSSHDELHGFYADTPLGPWTPHASNPLKSDARCARPAGRVVRDGDRIFRPVQDCDASYGAALVWCEILDLTPLTFSEKTLARTPPPKGFEGMHTYNRSGDLEVSDVRRVARKGIGTAKVIDP